ncbi:MAG TPA: mannose-1-phosphate guanylyltransferase/mannose-6-phosphate isomerase, partial [Pelagibacterium sp.]|nr:mannose-1-phosphate guanylyltransferase/mannose-6-phosphate isomerase [Pelagibacterium sp.]
KPTEPATGFGYIEAGDALASGAFAVKRFVERPDAEAAQSMIADGGFSWNSGMFVFSTTHFLKECRAHA